ncbi:Arrestin-C domain-containing protein [Mycena sanguinolenta]|uniref:Arrestin-C domain-containing protein n=1 Tax=Mycena sanguinolenta TaxID=230812 RepID=A0A8H6Z1H7_9AGAR|nr:Arrestin-C domain-containing protein [Mycena sanguinolenta]
MPFFKSKTAFTEEHSSSRSNQESHMEILLDHEYVFLRGTGADVEPARISGNVALYLTESTTIRSITLQFRGKAHLPVPPQEQHSSANPPSTYILCKHNWSFLEGQKKHSYTLKAGRHLFPFQLQVGGSLPRSVITDAFGGASVTYKLRAVAQRTGTFSHNIQAVAPVYLVRSLGSTALEYQQTSAIDHTWEQKLMFSVEIPHSAWAAGDEFVSLMKIAPLVKGVGVLTVTTSLRETTKVFGLSNTVTRTVASVTHEIIGGRAVEMKELVDTKGKQPQFSLPLSQRSATPSGPSGSGGSGSNSNSIISNSPQPPTDPAQSEDDVIVSLPMRIPQHLAPSHPLDPIKITHQIRWSVIVTNADGHLSELFCSLPVILLDSQLLSEARAHTRLARQLLIGGPEVSTNSAPDTNELPSYVAHVRDRVANMFLPEGQTLRVTNPWVRLGVSPILGGDRPQSSNATPLEIISDTNDSYVPDPEHPVFLDWVNAELLISHRGSKSTRPPSIPEDSDGPMSADNSGMHTPASDHPPTPPTPPANGVTTYTHTSTTSRELPQLFAATMEPTSALTHPHWLITRPDPKDPRVSSVDIQRRVREISVPRPEPDSVLLHKAFTEVPDYEVALQGFLGGVPPLSSMHGLPSYAEASRSGTPDLGAKQST